MVQHIMPDSANISITLGGNPDRETIFRAVTEAYNPVWERDVWSKPELPDFDAREAQPPLLDLIASGRLDLPKQGRALVPGCGTAYEAVAIASRLGLVTLGIDLSATAVTKAREYAKENAPQAGSVSVEEANFFEIDGPFDLVFDYQFLVALPTVIRWKWGEQMNKIMKPGGYLITLIFPMDEVRSEGVPMHPDQLHGLLGDAWEVVLDEVPKNSIPSNVGRERIIVRRKL